MSLRLWLLLLISPSVSEMNAFSSMHANLQGTRRPLVGISGCYLGSSHRISNPLSVHLAFDGYAVSVRPAPNGEGLVLEGSSLGGTNLGEFGVIVETDLSTTSPFEPLIGHEVEMVRRVIGKPYQDDLGVCLTFSAGNLFVVDLGDELFVGADLPPAVDFVLA